MRATVTGTEMEMATEMEMEMNTKTPDNNSINLPSPVWHIQQVMQANGFPRRGGEEEKEVKPKP